MKNVNESLIIDVDEIKNDDVNLNEIRKQFDKEIKQVPDGMREIMINQKNMYLKIRKMEDEKIRFIVEIERLNNIINELEKYFDKELENLDYREEKLYTQGIHDTIIGHKYKLQELKGVDKE